MDILKKSSILLVFSLFLSLPAWSAPKVNVELEYRKVIAYQTEQEKVVKAETVRPGDIIEYQLVVSNDGDSAATNVKPVGNIPESTEYLPEAASNLEYALLFSIDKGKSFSPKPMITVLEEGKEVKKPAPFSMYNKIKWELRQDLEAGGKKVLKYRVKIK